MIGRNLTREWVQRGNERSGVADKALVLNNFYLYVDPADGSVASHLLNEGYWESWITSWMTVAIQDGWNCLDVGANFGYYTGVFANLTSGDIIAFEPNPTIAKMLEKSIKENGWKNVRLQPYAVGSKDDVMPLTMVDGYQGSASLSLTEEYFMKWGGTLQTYDVPVRKLDDLVGSRKKWDFIKIDVEGWEPEVFKGATEVLSYNPVIVIEITPSHPVTFLDMLFNDYHVTSIGFEGKEEPVRRQDIVAQEWWMLVLRLKEG